MRQGLAVDPDALQDTETTLVVEGQLTGKVIGKLSGFKAAKGPKILR